ncbi:MAG: NUDIX hydrolase [Gammaproteobacteria bacterium]|nr:NUDIX hydrolase [Gammaproteobacteria bacterium]
MTQQSNQSPRVVVAGLLKRDNAYLLVSEKFSDGTEKWIVPGGGVEFGETLEEAVKREMHEELGVNVRVKQFIGFKEAVFADHGYHTVIFFYQVESDDAPEKKEACIIDTSFVSASEAKKLPLVDSARWLFDHKI